MRTLALAVARASFFVLIVTSSVSAQAGKQPFTAEDMLKVTSISVLDISDDGRRVAASARTSWDNPETDHRRCGDPMYLSPSRVTLLVIDTKTGATEKPFKGLASVRRAAWSRDGKRLAILTADEESGLPVAHLFIWDTDRAALAEVPRQPGVSIAANTDLDWTPDGAKLIVALRTPEQDREAKARFKAITEGPVIVQKSSEAFMEWDTIGRMSRERELVELDVKTGQRTTLLAARKISSYDVARDGSFLTFMQDVTGKTDYDAFTSVTPLTNLNAWAMAKALPKSELVAYRDADGKELYGVLRYPVDYVKGQKYPTVFEIYETFFDNGFNGRAAFLTNHGYAVFHHALRRLGKDVE